jgi:multiple sugar transport system substrate-binding protein
VTKLLGMTWSHPRGYDPMVATAAEWLKRSGVEITWEKRSLQDFEAYPVQDLARRYDLIVIDHPHVGEVTAQNCLAALDVPGRDADRAVIAKGTVGRSYESYNYAGHQWAFPIDAAAQVMGWRPDRLATPPQSWGDVVAMAKSGKVVFPLLPPHSLMSFFTLTASLGAPSNTERGRFVDPSAGTDALNMLAAVTAHIDPRCFDMDPIAASELLAADGGDLALMPLGYGYVSYARDGFRTKRLQFGNIPVAEHKGSALGGTGIAVSAFSKNVAAAADYAYWVASEAVQASLYAKSGGQPGHASGWESEAVNAPVHSFYRDTRLTLERAYVRPRHHGYMAFQDKASKRINVGLRSGEPPAAIVADLDRLYEESF